MEHRAPTISGTCARPEAFRGAGGCARWSLPAKSIHIPLCRQCGQLFLFASLGRPDALHHYLPVAGTSSGIRRRRSLPFHSEALDARIAKSATLAPCTVISRGATFGSQPETPEAPEFRASVGANSPPNRPQVEFSGDHRSCCLPWRAAPVWWHYRLEESTMNAASSWPRDADQHYYEVEDSFTRHLPKAFRKRGICLLYTSPSPRDRG